MMRESVQNDRLIPDKKATWEQILTAGKAFLGGAGIAEANLDAWYLFEQAFHMDKARYFLRCREQACAGEEELCLYEEMLRIRAARVPLQHILGSQDFMGLTFLVSGDVLIPRQDTETLVETVLLENRERNISILDMCTGSGCIAVSLAALGGYSHVEAADISGPALRVAKENAKRLLTGQVIRFRQSDLFSEFGEGDWFDLIVSNPPYIPSSVIGELEPEVRDFEPRKALDGMEDGLFFYRRLAEESPGYLKPGGKVYFEIGYDQGQAVCDLLARNGFIEIRVIKDLAGKDRIVCGKLQGRCAGV